MSKHLIINKLNKCKAYEFAQQHSNLNPLQSDNSTSKVSTSTTTHQSPNLNPQFTFKANELKSVLKPKCKEFFQSFDAQNDVIYQKAVLVRPKMLERALEFELMGLSNREDKPLEHGQMDKMDSKRLVFEEVRQISPERYILSNMPLTQQNIEVRQLPYRFPQTIKTEYTQYMEHPTQSYKRLPSYNPPSNQPSQYMQYFQQQNIPYDSKKYKLSRQKSTEKYHPSFRQQTNSMFNPITKRCQTEANQMHYQDQLFQGSTLSTYQSQQVLNDHFDDYHFVTRDLNEGKVDVFNDYYVNGKGNLQRCQNRESVEKNEENHGCGMLSKRSGNSSRLSFFRKERQHQFRKSLLEEFTGHNNNNPSNIFKNNQSHLSKRSATNQPSNKQNIPSSSNTKPIPSLAFNNLSQAAQRKLKSQYSERQLLTRRYLHQPIQSGHKVMVHPKGSSYINRDTETRIQSIKKQLKEIYQVKDCKERAKLKIMRDQKEMVEHNNARNLLRRVGSICKL